jgi:signal transduction histidine kinase
MDLGLGFDQAAIADLAEPGDDPVLANLGRAAASERAAATGQLGLRSMAERIRVAGGRLEIGSQPYQGTQVVLRLPG